MTDDVTALASFRKWAAENPITANAVGAAAAVAALAERDAEIALMLADLYKIAKALDIPALPYSGHEAIERDFLPRIAALAACQREKDEPRRKPGECVVCGHHESVHRGPCQLALCDCRGYTKLPAHTGEPTPPTPSEQWDTTRRGTEPVP